MRAELGKVDTHGSLCLKDGQSGNGRGSRRRIWKSVARSKEQSNKF